MCIVCGWVCGCVGGWVSVGVVIGWWGHKHLKCKAKFEHSPSFYSYHNFVFFLEYDLLE